MAKAGLLSKSAAFCEGGIVVLIHELKRQLLSGAFYCFYNEKSETHVSIGNFY